MLESWILPVAILAVFAVLLIVPLAEALIPRMRKRRFVCPWVDAEVEVEFRESAPFGVVDPPDVASCSALPDPRNPTCGKGCLEMVGPRSVEPEAEDASLPGERIHSTPFTGEAR